MKLFNNLRKRGLALFLVLTMCMSMLPATAMAEEAEADAPARENQIIGHGEETEVAETGGRIKHSKMIEQTGENEFEITLTVKTGETIKKQTVAADAAVVLVFDASKSMSDANINEARTAAKKFVEEFVKDAGDSKRMVSVARFYFEADTVLPWTDARPTVDSPKYAAAVDTELDKYIRKTDSYGTNIEAGLMLARNLLKDKTVEDIPNKFVILMTDGAPTCYAASNSSSITIIGGSSPQKNIQVVNHEDYRYIYCSDPSHNDGPTRPQEINELGAKLYSIYYQTSQTSNITVNGQEVYDWLGAFSNKAYEAKDAAGLFSSLEGISKTIKNLAQAWKLTDPMGEHIEFLGGDQIAVLNEGETSQKPAQFRDGILNWDLKGAEPVNTETVGDTTWYTYKLTYKIRLRTEDPDFVEGEIYNTSKTTVLNYALSDEDGNVQADTLLETELTVPQISGKAPRVTYTVNYWYFDNDKDDYVIGKTVASKEPVKLWSEIEVTGDPQVTAGYQLHDDADDETYKNDLGKKTLSKDQMVFNVYYDLIPTVRYMVKWLDKDGNELKPADMTRVDEIGKAVSVTDADKADIIKDGSTYKFDAGNTDNVLEGTLSKDGLVTLTLVFGKIEVPTDPPVVEPDPVVYLVKWVDENGNELKGMASRTGDDGAEVSVTDADKADITKDGSAYKFDAGNTGNVLEGTLSKDGLVILTLVFGKTEVPADPPVVEPDPVVYLVKWVDEDGNELKETAFRTGADGADVSVTDADKADITKDGSAYKFDAANSGNVLEGTLSAESVVILTLVFKKTAVPVKPVEGPYGVSYLIEYWKDDESAPFDTVRKVVELENRNDKVEVQVGLEDIQDVDGYSFNASKSELTGTVELGQVLILQVVYTKNPEPKSGDVVVTNTAGQKTAKVGETVTWTVTVTNESVDYPYVGLRLVDLLNGEENSDVTIGMGDYDAFNRDEESALIASELDETPAEEPAEAPAAEIFEEPAEEPAEDPAAETSEESAEEPAEAPAEEISEEPAEEPDEEIDEDFDQMDKFMVFAALQADPACFELWPGETVTFTASYVVKDGDLKLENVAVVYDDATNPDEPVGSGEADGIDVIYPSDPDPVKYTLTINYVYDNGETAARTHTEQLVAGASYSVTSPVIEGYEADVATVAGVMPEKDHAITVTYSAVAPVTPVTPVIPVIPVTPTIPDGPTPLAPAGATITDGEVPLAAPGLNSTDHFDYIKGYADGTVRPEASITRAEVATIFFRLMTNDFRTANWATENDFSDVQGSDWYNNAVSTCAKAGILKGYPDGTFKPNNTITRAEFASIAASFASEEVAQRGRFSDVQEGYWAADAIERAAAAGWIKGSDGKFRPEDQITRAEVIVTVNRMLDRVPDMAHLLDGMKTFSDNTPDKWYYADIQEATNSHDYERAEDGVTGIWTGLLSEQDWTALEKEWATAADANVVDVASGLQGEGEKAEDDTDDTTDDTIDGDGE